MKNCIYVSVFLLSILCCCCCLLCLQKTLWSKRGAPRLILHTRNLYGLRLFVCPTRDILSVGADRDTERHREKKIVAFSLSFFARLSITIAILAMGKGLCPQLTLADVVVCLSACANNAIVFVFIVALNTLFNDWMASFSADRSSTASVQAVCIGITCGGGLIAGVLERKLGQRMSLLLGSLLSTAGFFGGGFANSLPALIVSVGVVTGSGYCLVFLSTTSAVLQRFPNKASFVNLAMNVATGLGLIGCPFLYRYFADTYSWRGCLIIVGALCFHSTIFSLLLTSQLFRNPRLPDAKPSPLLPHPELLDPTDLHTSPRSTVFLVQEEASCDDLKNEELSHSDDVANQGIPRDLNEVTNSASEQDLLTTSAESQQGRTGVKGLDEPLTRHTSEEDDAFNTQETVETYHGSRHTLSSPVQPSSIEKNCTLEENVCRIPDDSESVSKTEESPVKKARLQTWVRQASFLTNRLYIVVVVCCVLNIGITNCFCFLVLDYAKHQGWTLQDGIFLNFVAMLSSLISRCLLMVVTLNRQISSITILGLAGIVGCVGAGLMGQVSNYTLAACLYSCLSICQTVSASMFGPGVLEVTREQELSLALGLGFTSEGLLVIAITAFAGSVHQRPPQRHDDEDTRRNTEVAPTEDRRSSL
ncbi:uncharacterized protein LOC143291172 isoform X2 [Babylonia areolata]|uniref:uncharacterized protein LOC143291172 isoform X2 n=1 Tax=Babylonia areolata TaxID=304850 RepID=UPI003FD10532